MSAKKLTAIAFVALVAMSFALAPHAFATSSSSNYPFELVLRTPYVALSGTPNPFGSVSYASLSFTPLAAQAMPFAWVPESSYSTSPGHGL